MTTQSMLDERYGRTRGSRAVLVALGIVAAGVVGWFGWSIAANPATGVSADDTAFEVADRAVRVHFQLTAPAGTTVACAIEALDEEHGVVGWKVVEIPASDTHVRAFAETVPTVAAATTGLVNACWVT
ncbi:MAG: DUF4307 domain-containing protein [Microbacterium sp.]